MRKMTPDEIEKAINAGGLGPIDLPAEQYHAMRYFYSHSLLRKMKESPAKFLWEIEHPKPSSPAQFLGTAIHMALLEPDLFEKTYAAMPKVDRRTKEGKAAASAWEEANKGKIALSEEEMDTVTRVHAKASDDDFFGQFLRPGDHESSFFAIDPETKIKVRCRVDNYLPIQNIVVDIKTTDCAHPFVFNHDITKYGYLTQGAFYMNVVGAATGKRPDAFVIIAVEKSRDCDMQAFYFDDEALEIGRKMYRSWMTQLADCLKTKEWPGYPREFIAYRVPGWLQAAVDAGEFGA